MTNANFLTANISGIELMPGVNDTAVGYDVNRVIQALNGTNLIPITTGNLTVSGNEIISGTLNVTGLTTLSGGVSVGNLTGPLLINPGPLEISIGAGNSGTDYEYFNVHHNFFGVGPNTGTMKISMPVAAYKIATMQHIRIRGYDYTNNRGPWEVMVGGYNFTDGNWYNFNARIIGRAPFNSVRLAQDGTVNCILLGTTSSVWNYTDITVDMIAMYGSQQPSIWGSGWASSIIASETGITNIFTPTLDVWTDSSTGVLNANQGLSVTGTATAIGTLQATGSNGGVEIDDRTGTAPTAWVAYATGGVFRLWNVTNSDRLQMDGSGNTSFYGAVSIPPSVGGTMSTTSYGTVPVKIAEVSPNGVNSVQLGPSPLPTGFRHLLIQWHARGDLAQLNTQIAFRINTLTGTYDTAIVFFQGSVTLVSAAEDATLSFMHMGYIPGATAQAGLFGTGECKIMNYNSTSGHKTTIHQSAWSEAVASNQTIRSTIGASSWRTTGTAITRIDVMCGSGNFVSGSVITLYGLP